MSYPASQKFKLILVLGLLTAIGPFSIDMYLPGFPAIAADFNTDVAKIQLSLSSFFIGISVGQMLYGPLLDRFGRKKPLFIGLTIYMLASLGCALAGTADTLIVLRLLQALGSCSGLVASRAMVRDLFPVEDNAKVFSMLMLVIGVSPIIAPTLGGYLIAHVGWQAIFYVLAVMGAVITTAVIIFLPESRPPDPNFSLKPRAIVSGFVSVWRVPQFYTYTLTGSLASAALYAYLAGSPFVFIERFQVSEQSYGLIFAIIAGGLITASQINSVLLRKYTSQKVIIVALVWQVVSGIFLATGTALGWLNLYGTVFFCFTFLCCQGFIFPNTSALALAPFSKNAGSASALMGSIQMGIGAFASAMVSVFFNGTAIPMTGIMAMCTISSFAMLYIGNKIIGARKTATKATTQEAADVAMSPQG